LRPADEGRQGPGYRLGRSSAGVACSETRPTSRFAALPRSARAILIGPSDHESPMSPGSPVRVPRVPE